MLRELQFALAHTTGQSVPRGRRIADHVLVLHRTLLIRNIRHQRLPLHERIVEWIVSAARSLITALTHDGGHELGCRATALMVLGNSLPGARVGGGPMEKLVRVATSIAAFHHERL